MSILERSGISNRTANDRWIASKEAAAYIGVEVSTLAKWRQRGVGPRYSCALGRDPRYRLSDLEDFMVESLAGNTVEARTLRRAARERTILGGYGDR